MSEQYNCTRIHDHSGNQCPDCGVVQRVTPTDFIVNDPNFTAPDPNFCKTVTLTLSPDVARFVNRLLNVRADWRQHRVERIAVVDLQNLEVGCVIAFEGT